MPRTATSASPAPPRRRASGPKAEARRERGPALAEVIEALGPGVVRVLASPKGLAVEIGSPLIHDPADQPSAGRGDMVLGVGVAAGKHDAIQLVEDAAAAGASAVVVRLDGEAPPRLVQAAET